jgi:probable HAF family extracellular repeat protein
MKSTIQSALQKVAVVLSLSASLTLPLRLAGQNQTDPSSSSVRYKVIDLGTLNGATYSQPFFMNKNGAVSGAAALPDNTQVHAALFSRGQVTDLGTLGGPNSIGFGINGNGQVAGEAETSASDPNQEDFCGFGTHLICQPFLWENGIMLPLPTLGGNNGAVNQINDWGIAVGFAENNRPDKACPKPQVLHIKPVIWAYGKAYQLPTVGGDPDGMALGVNDDGLVVGASGTCTSLNPNTLLSVQAVHPILWELGHATDLGNLGGTTGQAGGNMAWGVNRHGVVAGVSDLPGDTTFHAFRWTKATGMQDLGALSGDTNSTASSLNDEGDIVGLSLGNNGPRAFLWRHGSMTDLNTLVSGNSLLYLLSACSINAHREIAGLGVTATGELHAYKAIPIDDEGSGI